MNVVYLIQAGEDGPVVTGSIERRALSRRIKRLQEGNPALLHVRALLDGDERLEHKLHVRWHAHYIRGGWFATAVLDDLPTDAERVEDDDDTDEVRRRVVTELDDLLEGSR